jgi:hypothetical protein
MSKQNKPGANDVDQEKDTSSGASALKDVNRDRSADKNSGRQTAASSGTTSLGAEADESGRSGPGGIEGTGGPA